MLVSVALAPKPQTTAMSPARTVIAPEVTVVTPFTPVIAVAETSVTATADHSFQMTPTVTLTPAAAVILMRQNVDSATYISLPSGAT